MNHACDGFDTYPNRRTMLRRAAAGFGGLALSGLLASQQSASAVPVEGPGMGHLKQFHFAPRARRIIFLFMWGGPSHVDLFDPKPRLNQHHGQTITGEAVGSPGKNLGTALGSPFKFKRHGEGGIWISELFPQVARHADRLCVINSLHTEGQAHGEALLRLHTGQANLVRPSIGSWLSYGLGSENENLPAFITISPPRGHGGVQNYGSAFLPAIHQGTAIGSAETPIAKARIANLGNSQIDTQTQREQLDLVQLLNEEHLQTLERDQGIEGLIANYELAFRMQSTIPDLMNLETESSEIHRLYGIGQEPTDNFGRQCLLARRFAEAGVRYIQVSTDYTWDHHQKVQEGLIGESARVDQPIYGLLTDLASRGLLDDTLVVWGAEFGRTPSSENTDGRGHHPQAFTMWLAGGGVKGGFTYGATDDFGYAPVEQPIHMHDLHATLLYALGIDHEQLTYRHAGRDFRLTDVHGNIVHDLFV